MKKTINQFELTFFKKIWRGEVSPNFSASLTKFIAY